MGIQKDAEEILIYCYKHKLEGKGMPLQDDLIRLTKWQKNRVVFALEYLVRADLIMGSTHGAVGTTGTRFVRLKDIPPEGINTIENPKIFERKFNHTINLGIYKFSWGAEEKNK